jgi:hypothetical protein
LGIGGALFGKRDALGHGHTAIGILFASHHEACGVDVLAVGPASFKVGTQVQLAIFGIR